LAGLAGGLVIFVLAGISHSMTIADSQLDFSGTQGVNNWYYGFFDTPASSSSFILMSHYSNGAWSESTSYPPYTILWDIGGHPSGSPHGA